MIFHDTGQLTNVTNLDSFATVQPFFQNVQLLYPLHFVNIVYIYTCHLTIPHEGKNCSRKDYFAVYTIHMGGKCKKIMAVVEIKAYILVLRIIFCLAKYQTETVLKQ